MRGDRGTCENGEPLGQGRSEGLGGTEFLRYLSPYVSVTTAIASFIFDDVSFDP